MNWEKPWVLGLAMFGSIIGFGVLLGLIEAITGVRVRIGIVLPFVAAFTLGQVHAWKTSNRITRQTRWQAAFFLALFNTLSNLALSPIVARAYAIPIDKLLLVILVVAPFLVVMAYFGLGMGSSTYLKRVNK